jgi:hypothetical protein
VLHSNSGYTCRKVRITLKFNFDGLEPEMGSDTPESVQPACFCPYSIFGTGLPWCLPNVHFSRQDGLSTGKNAEVPQPRSLQEQSHRPNCRPNCSGAIMDVMPTGRALAGCINDPYAAPSKTLTVKTCVAVAEPATEGLVRAQTAAHHSLV